MVVVVVKLGTWDLAGLLRSTKSTPSVYITPGHLYFDQFTAFCFVDRRGVKSVPSILSILIRMMKLRSLKRARTTQSTHSWCWSCRFCTRSRLLRIVSYPLLLQIRSYPCPILSHLKTCAQRDSSRLFYHDKEYFQCLLQLVMLLKCYRYSRRNSIAATWKT